MISEHETATDNAERAAFIHREIVQLIVLILVAVVAFFVTRAIAASNRETNVRDAAEWYTQGQQALQNGQLDAAIDAFRRAAVRNRADKRYVLSLARALTLEHDDDAAYGLLTTLREAAPEDAEVNLELAHLAARRDDVTEASRFFHNALYAPWPPELAASRRSVRLELVRFLLSHHQPGRALSELLAVAADLPDQPAAHLEVAQLFADAGDHGHGLEQFQRVLRQDPNDAVALAGAGRSAFHLGEYGAARTYLRRAPAALDDVAATREVVELVLSNDPLASRIGSAERRRRLTSNLEYARQRLDTCLAQRSGGQGTTEERALLDEAEGAAEQLQPTAPLDQDTIESDVELVDRIVREVVQGCGPATARDRALVLVGQRHGDRAR